MISFRFHVVSITAIFLAIAIGIVVGTTYVDGAVVDALRSQIDNVEENLADRRAENDRLERELGLAQAYIDSTSDFAVTNRLVDVPVLLVATRGIDEASVTTMAELTQQAGGVTPGVVWLEDRWELGSDDDRDALAAIIDGDPTDEVSDLRAAAWAAVMEELAEVDDVVASPPDPTTGETTTTTTAPDPPASVLEPLEEAGFLAVDALEPQNATLADLAGSAPRIILVTGTAAEPGPATLVPVIVDASVSGGLPTVVADVYVDDPEGPDRGDALLEVLPEARLEQIIVIDHGDRPEGQVASVLALDVVADGAFGHYGYGDGSAGVTPAWTPL
ncbi:MAG: copper transporter [Acidimicrobiales bacterium]